MSIVWDCFDDEPRIRSTYLGQTTTLSLAELADYIDASWVPVTEDFEFDE